MGFSSQEYWSGLPFPPPEDLPNLGIEPASLRSPALTDRFFTASIGVCYWITSVRLHLSGKWDWGATLTQLWRQLWRWHEINHIKCQAHSKCSVNISSYYIFLIWHGILFRGPGNCHLILSKTIKHYVFGASLVNVLFLATEVIFLPLTSRQKISNGKAHFMLISTLICKMALNCL